MGSVFCVLLDVDCFNFLMYLYDLFNSWFLYFGLLFLYITIMGCDLSGDCVRVFCFLSATWFCGFTFVGVYFKD